MKFNRGVLVSVACFMAIAASAVAIIRYAEKGSSVSVTEAIAPKGSATAERMQEAMQLQFGPKSLTFVLPTCNTAAYADRFFLHLYTDATEKKSPTAYVNMDFDLTQEKGKEQLVDGVKKCVFSKSFKDFSLRAASIGQFTIPDGRCCDIVWSRHYIFDRASASAR